jgi:hypothetical protein
MKPQPPKKGTYVSVVFSDRSNRNLKNFFRNEIGINDIIEDLHVTVMYSPETLFYEEVDLGIKGELITFDNWSYELFGKEKDVLVIHFESELLSKTHEFLKGMGMRSTFPEYKPHMTIAEDVKHLPEIELPSNLRTHEIVKVIWEEIKDD